MRGSAPLNLKSIVNQRRADRSRKKERFMKAKKTDVRKSAEEITSAERGIKLLGVSRGELLEVLEATQIHTYASADIGALLTELANLSRDVETLLGESFCGIITEPSSGEDEPSSGEEWNGFDFFTSFAGMMMLVGMQIERRAHEKKAKGPLYALVDMEARGRLEPVVH
jgi:hypothetical protein